MASTKPIFTYGLNSKVVRVLNSYSGKDFIKAGSRIIEDAIGIPAKIRPQIRYRAQLPHDCRLGYAFCENEILVSQQTLYREKPFLFGALVHELTHCYHNMQVLRTENLGCEAINTYSVISARRNTEANILRIKNMSKAVMKREEQKAPAECIRDLIRAIRENKTDKIINLSQEMFVAILKENISYLNSIRSVLIREKGVINDNSAQGRAAGYLYKGFLKSNILDKEFSMTKYTSSITEKLANKEQKRAAEQYIKLQKAQ